MFLVFVVFCQFIIYPAEQLIKSMRVMSLASLPLIESYLIGAHKGVGTIRVP